MQKKKAWGGGGGGGEGKRARNRAGETPKEENVINSMCPSYLWAIYSKIHIKHKCSSAVFTYLTLE